MLEATVSPLNVDIVFKRAAITLKDESIQREISCQYESSQSAPRISISGQATARDNWEPLHKLDAQNQQG